MKNAAALLNRLSALPARARQILSAAALEAARQTARAAQSAAPVRTGALRASIAASPEENGARVETGVPYAGPVEMGTGHMRAQPFLQPAFDQNDFTARAARMLKEGLR